MSDKLSEDAKDVLHISTFMFVVVIFIASLVIANRLKGMQPKLDMLMEIHTLDTLVRKADWDGK